MGSTDSSTTPIHTLYAVTELVQALDGDLPNLDLLHSMEPPAVIPYISPKLPTEETIDPSGNVKGMEDFPSSSQSYPLTSISKPPPITQSHPNGHRHNEIDLGDDEDEIDRLGMGKRKQDEDLSGFADFIRAGPPSGYDGDNGSSFGRASSKKFNGKSGLATVSEKAAGPPVSSYSTSAIPASTMAYGTPPCGVIGVHFPREIVRIERDWSGGEVCQFYSSFPMELEGRITPTQFQHLINEMNTHLLSAYSQKAAVFEGVLAMLTWHTSLIWWESRFVKELKAIEKLIQEANDDLWNHQGLNILNPKKVALQYLEIEYY